MTRKDYRLIASILRTKREKLENETGSNSLLAVQLNQLTIEFANVLAEDNPRLNPLTFAVACLPKERKASK